MSTTIPNVIPSSPIISFLQKNKIAIIVSVVIIILLVTFLVINNITSSSAASSNLLTPTTTPPKRSKSINETNIDNNEPNVTKTTDNVINHNADFYKIISFMGTFTPTSGSNITLKCNIIKIGNICTLTWSEQPQSPVITNISGPYKTDIQDEFIPKIFYISNKIFCSLYDNKFIPFYVLVNDTGKVYIERGIDGGFQNNTKTIVYSSGISWVNKELTFEIENTYSYIVYSLPMKFTTEGVDNEPSLYLKCIIIRFLNFVFLHWSNTDNDIQISIDKNGSLKSDDSIPVEFTPDTKVTSTFRGKYGQNTIFNSIMDENGILTIQPCMDSKDEFAEPTTVNAPIMNLPGSYIIWLKEDGSNSKLQDYYYNVHKTHVRFFSIAGYGFKLNEIEVRTFKYKDIVYINWDTMTVATESGVLQTNIPLANHLLPDIDTYPNTIVRGKYGNTLVFINVKLIAPGLLEFRLLNDLFSSGLTVRIFGSFLSWKIKTPVATTSPTSLPTPSPSTGVR